MLNFTNYPIACILYKASAAQCESLNIMASTEFGRIGAKTVTRTSSYNWDQRQGRLRALRSAFDDGGEMCVDADRPVNRSKGARFYYIKLPPRDGKG